MGRVSGDHEGFVLNIYPMRDCGSETGLHGPGLRGRFPMAHEGLQFEEMSFCGSCRMAGRPAPVSGSEAEIFFNLGYPGNYLGGKGGIDRIGARTGVRTGYLSKCRGTET